MDLTNGDPEASQDWMARGRQGLTAEQTDADDSDGYNETFGTKDAQAASRYSEGDKVEVNGKKGVVSEVRTSTFEGPDGEIDASDNKPIYVVATVDGAEFVPASDLSASDWSTDQDDPAGDLSSKAQAGDVTADQLDLEAESTFRYPKSWRKSDTPSRLILLDAWASMGGQFDCGGGCCMGEMRSSGMSKKAASQFCASMKDRVLQWEGWRKGG